MPIDEPKISVLIAEDQLTTRIGLTVIIERFPDFILVGEAENGLIAIERAKQLNPTVVILDVGMPVMDGIEATKQLKELLPEVKVLILTSHDHDDDVFAALASGADGYCLKDASADNLATAIRTVSQGAAWLDQAIAKRVLRASSVSPDKQSKPMPTASSPRRDKFALSDREHQVLELLVGGMSNQQMAENLFISSETVKTHMRHIMEKLAVSDRTQAAVKALREGLLLVRQDSDR